MKLRLINAIIMLGSLLLFPIQIKTPETEVIHLDQITEIIVPEELSDLIEVSETVEEEQVANIVSHPTAIDIAKVSLWETTENIPVNRWNIRLTEDEIEMLAKIVFLEAHTQSNEGILAVIEVIFNRMISDDFPDTLEGVLGQTEPCLQFTTWKFIEKGKPTEKEYNMIYAALNGEKEVLTTEYVYFSRGKQNNNDPIRIEDHWFCKGYVYE